MILKLKLARGTPFLVFNVAAVLFVVIFLARTDPGALC